MATDTMVERMARALAQADLRADEQPIEHVIFEMRVKGWKPKARAALAAMRNPTENMVAEGCEVIENPAMPEKVWAAMVDTALSETEDT